MRILHYTLGIYPKRMGGMNKYATDLMIEQSKSNHVMALFPGSWKPWISFCKISHQHDFKKIKCYSLINSLPIPLFGGIRKVDDFINLTLDERDIEVFYLETKPDVLHLHTLMGFPIELLLFLRKKNVKIVYTSHDFYGLCPKVNFINSKGVLCKGPDPSSCLVCNQNSPSTFYLRLRNSKFVFYIRDLIRWVNTRKS